ncbi:hypothetical protein DM860_017694 [Cuscuta australis]|uniref:Uncharacterized protein n=1 Tax=Cuscuta australis TaxID=267555 RepID=A0A328D5Z6_9ASTE|nr:hypothetical protein DM860_017694 [Cuscuta australis]
MLKECMNVIVQIPRRVENSLRDRAKAVANRVSITRDGDGGGCMKACCRVCLTPISMDKTLEASDLRMSLAIHLSLYHPDDINLMWEMMMVQNKGKSYVHVPSFLLGVGMSAGIGALTLLAKTWTRPTANKRISRHRCLGGVLGWIEQMSGKNGVAKRSYR